MEETTTPSTSFRRGPRAAAAADTSISGTLVNPATPLSPKSVLLYDWWLVRAEGNRVAVSGLASRGRIGVRLFNSAPISKRIDATTLETSDGFTLTISGLINRSRSHENGFPSEVCSHFLYGFPCNWEESSSKCYEQESTNSLHGRNSGFIDLNISSIWNTSSSQPASSDNLPFTRLRHLFTCLPEDSKDGLFGDILGKLKENAFQQTPLPAHSNKKLESSTTATRRVRKTAKASEKHRVSDRISVATSISTPESLSLPSKGVMTRSMSRLSELRSNAEDNLDINSSVIGNNLKSKTWENPDLNSPVIRNNLFPDAYVLRRSGRPKVRVNYAELKRTKN